MHCKSSQSIAIPVTYIRFISFCIISLDFILFRSKRFVSTSYAKAVTAIEPNVAQ